MLGFCLKKHLKNLLSRKVFKGAALTFKLSKIKPKVLLSKVEGLSRLSIISALLIFLSGYWPVFAFPPVKQAIASAQSKEQKQEIIASSFPHPLVLPHPGYLSTKFSRMHPGIDIAAGVGMPIHPITEGIVEEVNFSFWGYGNHVVLSHANGFKSHYAHMGKVYVKIGQRITSETTLGELGMTGATSGPHTHLEITFNGSYIDPETILPEFRK